MNNLYKARIFSFFVIFSMLLSALGAPNMVASAATTVTVESVSAIFKGNSSTASPYTISWSHTTGTGSNRLLLVGVSYNANTNVSPITAVSFTPSGGSEIPLSLAIGRKLSWLYRFNYIYYSPTEPDSGTTGTIKVTFAASVQSGIVAASANLAGVDTTTPIGPSNGVENVSAAPSVTVNGLVGDELVVDNLFMGGTTPASTVVGAGQTILTGWNTNQGNSFGGASTKDANLNTSVTMSWTPSGTPAGTFIWIHLAAAINPACVGDRYTLTLGTDPNGTVTQSPAGTSFCAGRTVTLTPKPTTTGYIFKDWGGTNGGDMVSAGGGAYTIVMNGDKSVTPNFVLAQTSPCPNTANLNAVADTFISAATGAALYNYGGATTLQVDRNNTTTPTNRRYTFLKWDVSGVPSNAIIDSARIILNVTDDSTAAVYPMYDVTKPWVEGTQNGAADAAGASWTNYNTTGPFPWGAAGGSQTGTGSIDRDTLNLWTTTASSFTPVGSKTVSMSADGLTVVRRWLAGGVNNGVIIQQTTSGTSDTLAFDSREGATPPVLSVTYCLPSSTTTYTLTAGNDGNGSVTLNPAGGTYASGTTVTLTPVPNDHYLFGSWSGADSGDVQGSGPSYTITMDADKTIQANFVAAHKLTVAVNPVSAGTTSPTVGDHWYVSGTLGVSVTQTPATGYTFSGWSGGDCTGTAPCSVDMTADRSVTANYTLTQYALNLTFGGGGGGHVTSAPAGIDCTVSCSHNFDYSTSPVVLTAVAATGSTFAGWSGETCSGTGTCSVTMTAIRNVTATFNIIPTHTLTLAVDPVASGITDPAVGGHIYNEGDVVVVAATAASGYVFDHWTGDVNYAYSATTTVTMSGDKTATAHFTAAPFGYIGDAGPSVYVDASGTSMAITVGSAGVAVGNTIMVGFASRGVQNYTTPTVTDSKGNTYTSALCSLAYTHGREYLLYAPVTTALVGGDTITLTSSPAVTNRVMVASVFSGLLTSGQLDQTKISTDCSLTTSAVASNDATSGATDTTTQADELVIGLIAAEDSGGTTPVDAGLGTWLNSFMAGATQKSQNTTSYRWRVSMGRYYASATGTFTAAQTYTNNPYWTAAVATFKAAPIGPSCYTLTLSHTGNGGDPTADLPNSEGCPSGQYLAGEELTLTAHPDSGYQVGSWSGTNGALDNTLTMPAEDHAASVTYTALPNHTVTFDANGGTGTMTPQVANVPTILTLNTFTRTGYLFIWWNTQADGQGIQWSNGANYPFAADVTLYAQWTDNTPPTVTSITRVTANPTNLASVDFLVTFSEAVTGVDVSDFALTRWVQTGSSITGVSGTGATRTVSVNTGTGNVSIRLDVIDDDSIIDLASHPLGGTGAGNGNHTSGELYTVVKFHPVTSDFDHDGKTDPAKYDPLTGIVSWLKSSTDTWDSAELGLDTTSIVTRSDFDGDGKTDPAKFVPSDGSLWYIKSTSAAWDGTYLGPGSYQYVNGSDYDGDGRTDMAVFISTNALWYQPSIPGGWQGLYMGPGTFDLVNGSDFDGDHKTDPALFVPGVNAMWYFKSSTSTWQGVYMGPGSYEIVPASDFDGDGKTDPAQFDSTNKVLWYQQSSDSTWKGVYMGSDATTYVSAADFDGDGITDPAKFVPGTNVLWYLPSDGGDWVGVWMGEGTYDIVN